MTRSGSLGASCILLAACVSANTSQRLDHTYAATSTLLSRHRERSAAAPISKLATKLDGAIERDTIIALAVAQSPALAAMAHRARAMLRGARAEGSLPSPEIGLEAWNLPLARPYAVGDADMYMVELRQRFPAAGSLDARARAASEDAAAMLAEVASEERVVAQRAADAYADYLSGLRSAALHHQHLALLEQMQGAVQARFTTGGSGLADAARVDLETAKTHRAIVRINGDIARARATINALLRRPATATLGTPRETGAETVHLPLAELVTRARSVRGTAVSAQARTRAAQARQEAAEAEASIPELMVGLGYWQAPSMRPGFGANVSISLPWLWGPGNERVAEARELVATERAGQDTAMVEAITEISEGRAQLDAIEQELRAVHQQAMPAAQHAIEAIHAGYATGHANLLEWLDAARSLLDLGVEEAELSAEASRAVAALELAVGSALPRVAIKDGP